MMTRSGLLKLSTLVEVKAVDPAGKLSYEVIVDTGIAMTTILLLVYVVTPAVPLWMYDVEVEYGCVVPMMTKSGSLELPTLVKVKAVHQAGKLSYEVTVDTGVAI
jgi:hypothetical protein